MVAIGLEGWMLKDKAGLVYLPAPLFLLYLNTMNL